MIKNVLICRLILITIFILPSISFAADIPKKQATKENTPIETQRKQSELLAHKMMGHVNLAQFALGLKLPDEATHQIEKAQTIEAQLASQLPELKINSSLNYGKVTYDDSHTIKEHYVPVVDDILLVSDYEAISKNSKELDLKETSAGVVHVGVSVDLREVKTSLNTALNDINKKKYSQAQSALTGIFKSAIIDEEEIDDPILAISGNLALAKSFLNARQYDRARFTLKYIQKRLFSASASNVSFSNVHKASVKKLLVDLDKLKAELRKKDPTITQRISDQFDKWKKAVGGWGN